MPQGGHSCVVLQRFCQIAALFACSSGGIPRVPGYVEPCSKTCRRVNI